MQMLGFTLAGEPYAVPVDTVREVVDTARPRLVPGTPPWLAGLISLRGRLVPVCDVAARLGLDARGGPVLVVAAHGERLVGLRVDAVQGILEVPADRLAPLPVGDEPLLAGIAEVDGALLVALDVEAIAAEIASTRGAPPTDGPAPQR